MSLSIMQYKQSRFGLIQRCDLCLARGSSSLGYVDSIKFLRDPLVMLVAADAPKSPPSSYCLCPFCNSYRPYCGNY